MEYFGLFVLQSSLLILMVLLIRAIGGKKISSRLIYAFWLIPMLRLLLPFAGVGVSEMSPLGKAMAVPGKMTEKLGESAADFLSDIFKEEETVVYEEAVQYFPSEQITTHEIGSMEYSAGEDVTEHTYMPAVKGTEGEDSLDFMDSKSHGMKIAALCFICIWMTGSIFLGIYSYYRNRRFLQYARAEGKRLEVPDGFENIPEVYRADWLSSPCLAGIWKPMILMNEKAASDDKIFRYALLHEKTHFEQKDHVWTMIRNILCILYWWNPLVWLGAECCAADAELACDSKVTSSMSGEQKREYGNVLLSLLDNGKGRAFNFCQTTTMAGDGKMLRRM